MCTLLSVCELRGALALGVGTEIRFRFGLLITKEMHLTAFCTVRRERGGKWSEHRSSVWKQHFSPSEIVMGLIFTLSTNQNQEPKPTVPTFNTNSTLLAAVFHIKGASEAAFHLFLVFVGFKLAHLRSTV